MTVLSEFLRSTMDRFIAQQEAKTLEQQKADNPQNEKKPPASVDRDEIEKGEE